VAMSRQTSHILSADDIIDYLYRFTVLLYCLSISYKYLCRLGNH
jgi:hypothetical protein